MGTHFANGQRSAVGVEHEGPTIHFFALAHLLSITTIRYWKYGPEGMRRARGEEGTAGSVDAMNHKIGKLGEGFLGWGIVDNVQ